MEDDDLTSVSKGCFVLRGHKTRGRCHLKLGKYFIGEDVRCKMAEAILRDIDRQVKNIQHRLTLDLFTSLTNFITESHSEHQDPGDGPVDIPAAALITGVNLTDHITLFSQLREYIETSATPHVAVLHSRNCSDVKASMKCIGEELILGGENEHNISAAESESEKTYSKNLIWKPSVPLTMPILETWYTEMGQDKSSRAKKNPVVIVFSDTEQFSSNVLQDIIAMISHVLKSVPFVLIFGVAMSWASVVNRQLPYSSTSLLSLVKFHAPPATDLLTTVVNDVLLSNELPFKLGGKSLQLLLNQFLCHDFSVTNFVNSLKYCVLEHFYEEPACILCTNNLEDMKNHVNNISDSTLQHMRSLPSVKQYFSSITTRQKESLEKNNETFRNFIRDSMLDLYDFHCCFFTLIKSLFSLVKSLPTIGFGRHLRQFFCMCYAHPITESTEYRQALILLRSCSREQLTQRIENSFIHLESLNCTKGRKNVYLEIVQKSKAAISSLLQELKQVVDGNDVVWEEKDDECVDVDAHQPMQRVKYTYQLREELQNRFKERQSKEMTGFQKLRMKAIDALDDLFKKTLRSPKSFVLHEVFYFDSTSALKMHIVPAPRLALQTALSTPHYYLKEQCLSSSDGCVPKSAPDVCIAYKLHKECGRIINLYDWLEAFHVIVTLDEDSREQDDMNEKSQARFARAVAELQFLGLIKPTKKKTDHVERLTWSQE